MAWDDNEMPEKTLRAAELMASRLCHDLVGPMGAVRNGLELAADDPDMAEEAMELTNESLAKLTATAQLFRMAYGAAGGALNPEEAGRLLKDYLSKHKITASWKVLPMGLDPIMPKLLINAAILAMEALPRGGNIDVIADSGPNSGRIIAHGADVRTPQALLDVLAGLEEPTAQTVQGEVLRLFCARAGYGVAASNKDGAFILALNGV